MLINIFSHCLYNESWNEKTLSMLNCFSLWNTIFFQPPGYGEQNDWHTQLLSQNIHLLFSDLVIGMAECNIWHSKGCFMYKISVQVVKYASQFVKSDILSLFQCVVLGCVNKAHIHWSQDACVFSYFYSHITCDITAFNLRCASHTWTEVSPYVLCLFFCFVFIRSLHNATFVSNVKLSWYAHRLRASRWTCLQDVLIEHMGFARGAVRLFYF